MRPSLYTAIKTLFDAAPKDGSRCSDAAYYAFQDAIHAFPGQAADTGLVQPLTDCEQFIRTAVETQARAYLAMIRNKAESCN